MSKQDDIKPVCHGQDCPLKENCLLFKEKINRKEEIWMAYAPYDPKKKKCEFHEPKSQQAAPDGGVH